MSDRWDGMGMGSREGLLGGWGWVEEGMGMGEERGVERGFVGDWGRGKRGFVGWG